MMATGERPNDGDDLTLASEQPQESSDARNLARLTTSDQNDEDLEAQAEAARNSRDLVSDSAEASSVSNRAPRKYVTPPAEGERNAVVGYLGQYEFASSRTIAALREGKLLSVRVADVHAGQIDDFQLQSSDIVDAHQVKWSLHPGSIGFAEFVNDTKEHTRFVRQLADGWERLKALHHPTRVVVHFVTNDFASINDNPSIPRPADASSRNVRTWSFAAFLAEAWFPAVEAIRAGREPRVVVPEPWLQAYDAFVTASGLQGSDVNRFVADCELQFGVPSLESSITSAPLSETERSILRKDAGVLAHAFMRLVARQDRQIEFTREQLLDVVGWRHRADFRNRHEFPDPDIPYRSI